MQAKTISLKSILEDIIMNKCLLSIIVVLVALTFIWAAFAGEGPRRDLRGLQNMSEKEKQKLEEQVKQKMQKFQNMSEEEKKKLREQVAPMMRRFQNMSEEERQAFMKQMRQSFDERNRLRREGQLKAIKSIQDQLAKLKTAIEATDPQAYGNFRNMSEEDRAKLTEKMAKSRTDYNKALVAIQQDLRTLGAPRPPMPGPSIGELTKIREIAVKEKAKLTAKSLDALIAKQKSQRRQRGERDTNAPALRRPAREGSKNR